MDYKGTIIEESLRNKDILKEVKILSTRVEIVTQEHRTPWLKKWTLHDIEIEEKKAKPVAQSISEDLDYTHGGAWYADFKNNDWHYIIFKDKIFRIQRQDGEGYKKAGEYGISLGIPEYQVDFSPNIK